MYHGSLSKLDTWVTITNTVLSRDTILERFLLAFSPWRDIEQTQLLDIGPLEMRFERLRRSLWISDTRPYFTCFI